MNCHNLKTVAKAMREKFPTREIIICADTDQFTVKEKTGEPWNPGVESATEAAHAIQANIATPIFADVSNQPTDFNDLQQQEGTATVKTQIESAQLPKETDDEIFERLAKLSPADYDRCRDGEAKRLKIRVVTLDNEI